MQFILRKLLLTSVWESFPVCIGSIECGKLPYGEGGDWDRLPTLPRGIVQGGIPIGRELDPKPVREDTQDKDFFF